MGTGSFFVLAFAMSVSPRSLLWDPSLHTSPTLREPGPEEPEAHVHAVVRGGGRTPLFSFVEYTNYLPVRTGFSTPSLGFLPLLGVDKSQ